MTARAVFCFMISLSIYGFSVNGNNVLSNNCYKFFTTNFLALLHSSCYNFYVKFRLNCVVPFTNMTGLNCNERRAYENCGTQTTKRNIVRQKTSCSAGSPIIPACTKLLTNIRAEINHHIAKKHSKATARVVHKCKLSDKDFHSSYLVREHKRK